MSVLLRLPARNVLTNDDRAEKERAVRVDIVRVIFAAERLAAYAVERREREYVRFPVGISELRV